jgi:hypothetical protein
MRPPDVPEVLIGLSLLAAIVWGIYNYAHRNVPH